MNTPYEVLKQQAYAGFDKDPQSLLATFGSPGPGGATWFHMRLMGYDDQITGEVQSLEYRSRWLTPIVPGRSALWRALREPPEQATIKPDPISTAVWEPLGWFCDAALDAMHAGGLPHEAIDRTTFQVRIRFLIYRRSS